MRILVVDDDRDALVSITNVLHAEYPHLEVRVAANAAAAHELASAEPFDLLLVSHRLSTRLDGLRGIPTVPFRKPVDPEHLLDLVRTGAPGKPDGSGL